jgi:hypothetical protein
MPCAQDAYMRHIARHGGRNDGVDLGGLINRVEMTVHRHSQISTIASCLVTVKTTATAVSRTVPVIGAMIR